MKKLLSIFFIMVFAYSAAQAAPIASTQNSNQNPVDAQTYNINIPQDTTDLIEEKDLVEIFCLEAKSQGGEAIASVEALDEGLNQSLDKLQDLGIKLNLDGISLSAQKLRKKIDAICAADNLDTAKKQADEFKSEADAIKIDLKNNLLANLNSQIEKQIKDKADALKVKYEKELNDEADSLIAQKKADYEKLIRAEAAEEQAKIQNRLQAEIEQEIVREYGGKESPDIEKLQAIGKQRGMARGEAERKNVEAKLRLKYEKIADEEKAKLNDLMQKKAAAKEEEIKALYKDFSNINKLIEKIKTKKYNSEWKIYQEKVRQAKINILKKIIAGQFEKAKNLIINQKTAIDLAYKENMNGNYGIPSADTLLRELETDRKEIISLFLDGDTSEAKIEKIKKRFSEKWEKIRTDLEKTKDTSLSEVFKRIKGKTNWSNLKSTLTKKQKYAKAQEKIYYETLSFCQKNPKAKVNANDLSNCVKCRALNKEYNNYFSVNVQVDKKINLILPLIDKLDNFQNNFPTLAKALNYKNDLQNAIYSLQAAEKEYKQSSKNYDDSVNYYKNICLSYK